MAPVPSERRGSLPARRRAVPFAAAVLSASALLALAGPASAAIQDFPVPTPDSELTDIATGKDGSLWFSEQKGGKVGRITTSGQIAEWTIPRDGEYGPEELTVAQDGRVWVLSDAHKQVFVIDPAVPDRPVSGYEFSGNVRGNDIAAAPDGSVWVTDSLNEGVHRFVGNQVFEATSAAPDCSFDGIIAPGPDGRMWCADNQDGDALKRIELDGVTATALPMPDGFNVSAMAAGPGGAMWYGRNSSGSFVFKPGDGVVGRMTPDGGVREWPVGDDVAPTSLAAGPDGAMWFGSIGNDKAIGRIAPDGTVTLASLGVRRANGVAFGGDGALWFIDTNANRVTRVTRDELVKGAGPAPAAGAPAIPKGTLRAAKGRVPVRVSCPTGAADRCRGTVRLRTAKKVRLGGRGRAAVRTVSTSGRYTLSPGRTGTIRVKLSSTGRKVVRKGRSTSVAVEATPTGAKKAAAKRTVTLRG